MGTDSFFLPVFGIAAKPGKERRCQHTTVITNFSDLEAIRKDHMLTLNGGLMPMDQYQAEDGRKEALQLIQSSAGTVTPAVCDKRKESVDNMSIPEAYQVVITTSHGLNIMLTNKREVNFRSFSHFVTISDAEKFAADLEQTFLLLIKKMQARNRCGATVSGVFNHRGANQGY